MATLLCLVALSPSPPSFQHILPVVRRGSVYGSVTPPEVCQKQKIWAKIDSTSSKIWFHKVVTIPFHYWFIFNSHIRAEEENVHHTWPELNQGNF